MKKIFAMVLGLAVLVSACGSNSSAEKVAQLESEIAALKQQSSETANSMLEEDTKKTTVLTTKVTNKATTTTKVQENQLGSRKNPAKIGDMMYISGTVNGTDIELEVMLNSVANGEEANTIIMEENQFNNIPSGYEAIILNFTITLTEYKPKDDSSYRISYLDGEFFSTDYKEIKRTESVVFPDELDGELYEGATITGNVAFIAPEGQASLYRYEDILWFDISK